MDVNFTCPHCEQALVIDSVGAGETISCPTCDQTIFAPLAPTKNTEVKLPVATEQQSVALDKIRNSARLTVEDHWRNFLTLVHIDKRKAFEALHNFDATINMATEYMPEPDASRFRRIIEEEREKLADEYDRNPDALKARLGLINQAPTFIRSHNRQGLDELIVRTAVRATIWESIWSIFRLFR
jgi:uncharacterized Zn finger protein (UPF0148 family)